MTKLKKCISRPAILVFTISVLLTHCSKDADIVHAPHKAQATIVVVSGNNQIGLGGEQLVNPIVIQISDSEQIPTEDIVVLFEIIKGNGFVNSSKVQTNDAGISEVLWTIGLGENEIRVSIEDDHYQAQPCYVQARGECYCKIPDQLDDGWETASIIEARLDVVKICGVLDEIYNPAYQFLYSLLIIKDGKLVFEEYPNSYRTRIQPIASITKSITSALIGIAIDEGFINNVNEHLFDFFPEYNHLRDESKDRILLKHVLSMTSGFECNELDIPYSDPRNDVNVGMRSGNYIEYVLKKLVVDEPGTKWNYNSGNTMLLGGIVKNTTGIHADEFAETRIFTSLGITDYQWAYQADGLPYTCCSLSLCSRDMAKFGYLYLLGGWWNGEQIVSEEWVNESTVSQVTEGHYGYQWWVGAIYGYDFYIAVGYGGQRIINVPELDMIIVHTSTLDNVEGLPERLELLNVIVKEIIEAAIEENLARVE